VSAGKRAVRRVAAAAAAVAFAFSLAGCASQWSSPRAPYAASPVEYAPDSPFAVLEHWDWHAGVDEAALPTGHRAALASGPLGLFQGDAFRLADRDCSDCRLPEAVLWHFEGEPVAVPRIGLERRSQTAQAVLAGDAPAYPAVIWLGAPERVRDATLAAGGEKIRVGDETLALQIVPQLASNRDFVDASTARFLASRPLALRGMTRMVDGVETFVARTLWPEDARIDAAALVLEPPRANEAFGTLIEAQSSALAADFPVRLLWERERSAPRDWAGRPGFALILSGAQGDDDGSRGGHLGIATGHFGPRGEWDHWLVENFYPVDEPNAKGIIPASVPADKYLADVNSGQLFYRPGYMLVAVLREPRIAAAMQTGLHTTLIDLYCRDIRYSRARHNSTAMSIDPLRELGWRIPAVGASSRILGLMLAPIAMVAGRSFAVGRELFGSLATEKTRLLPRVAFEVIAHDLLALSAGDFEDDARDELSDFERALVADVDAIAFMHLPQIPSTRRFGTFPEQSMLTYGARVFARPGGFERAPPAVARPFPSGLEESCASR
jgi:hypothetical protein